MGRVKDVLIEAEDVLVDCLDVKGMTNEQAFTTIKNKLGSMAEAHAREIIKQWNEGDETWQQ